MANLKSRKQIRKDLDSATAELEQLKSPEGLARYMISKGGDNDFEQRFQAEIQKIGEEHGARDNLDQVLHAEGMKDDVAEVLDVEPETFRHRVMVVRGEELLPLLDHDGDEYTSNDLITDDQIEALAVEHNVDRADLQIEHRAP